MFGSVAGFLCAVYIVAKDGVMQQIELSADEVETLRELIERRLTEMEVEIERTDTHDFKET